MVMEINMQGKTVVVTGATSGIGLTVAEKMAEAGAFVVGVGAHPSGMTGLQN